MKILNGKELASKIRTSLKNEVKSLQDDYSITPGLAVILVGDDSASKTYVAMKARACKEVGIYSITHEMPNTISQKQIIETIEKINQNDLIHGLLVQLPLPKHLDTEEIIEAIDPQKDVDGFHPFNFGRLVIGHDSFAPCTPLGVITLLKEYNIDLSGANACVVGASNIVGKPLAAMLLNEGATVDLCHILTQDLAAHTKRADIVLVGVGKAGLLTKDMIKDGAVIVDIGTNRCEDGRLVGDVDFEQVSQKASFITPVPGGVGPMTIATLLQNTALAARKRIHV